MARRLSLAPLLVTVVMVQYYTLEEAARALQTTPEKVKEMAKRGEVRAFQDRGNLRFRAQEIDELARARGLGSDPALTPSEGPKSPPPTAGGKHKSKIPPQGPIALVHDEDVPIGREPTTPGSKGGSPSGHKSPTSAKVGRKPTMTQPSGPKSPPPRAASDSDVRLVAQGSDLDFQVAPDEPKSGGSSKSGGKKSSKRPSKMDPPDSGVRIVPLDEASDSDVKLESGTGASESALAGPRSGKKPSDSDIRIEDISKGGKAGPKRPEHPITEDIDLDEEQQRAEAAARAKGGPGKAKPRAKPTNLPTSSPFELSESDIDMDAPAAKAPKEPKHADPAAKEGETDSSEDFELTPVGEGEASPLEISSSEVEALKTDDSEEVSLGELTGAGAARSGINLQDPADSGISLEQGGSDEIEFELSLDAGATPKPGPTPKEGDSSSEFEVTEAADAPAEEGSSEFELALDSADAPAGEEESSSEFELSLDVEGSSETEAAESAESDSEFELTLDAEGGVESGETDALAGEEGEKDIFETDFEVPALEDEESGSEAVVLEEDDTDLETSDFDLDLEEGASEEEDLESGSQVVALEDEEEADEAAETASAMPAARRRKAAAAEEEDELDLELDATAEAEEEEEAVAAAPAAPARWGPLPALLLIPTVLVMFFVGLLSFELAGSLWNYRQPGHATGFGIVLHPLAKYIDPSLPD